MVPVEYASIWLHCKMAVLFSHSCHSTLAVEFSVLSSVAIRHVNSVDKTCKVIFLYFFIIIYHSGGKYIGKKTLPPISRAIPCWPAGVTWHEQGVIITVREGQFEIFNTWSVWLWQPWQLRLNPHKTYFTCKVNWNGRIQNFGKETVGEGSPLYKVWGFPKRGRALGPPLWK